MDMNTKVAELFDYALSRRKWVRGTLAVAGGFALAGHFGLGRAFAQQLSNLDVLQFALTLEHLEANMYERMLATGILQGKEQMYFQSFRDHEQAHVQALQQTIQQLGGTPTQAHANYNFPPFNNRGDILNFAEMAEQIGVGAYTGAASILTDKDLLAAAGSIVQVEARHTATVRKLMMAGTNIEAVPEPLSVVLTVQEVQDKVAPILSSGS